ncbi:hypothetical protein F2P56_004753 [Juglans regia]|uniref:Uncharacterized protein n=1 Tax=Juglans regia TaxID=51240 RepID=A0A833Y4Y7_JUGRE|nr:hypothetical protein F2P56_004753 [Juglans regia]
MSSFLFPVETLDPLIRSPNLSLIMAPIFKTPCPQGGRRDPSIANKIPVYLYPPIALAISLIVQLEPYFQPSPCNGSTMFQIQDGGSLGGRLVAKLDSQFSFNSYGIWSRDLKLLSTSSGPVVPGM